MKEKTEPYQGVELTYEKGLSNVEKRDNVTYYSRKEENDESSLMNIYHVMDGVEFAYNHFHSKAAVNVSYTPKALNMLELNHCRQGRFGCLIEDHYVYLGQGEMELNILGVKRVDPEFPLGYYEGLSFVIDVDIFVQTIQSLFPNVASSILDLKKQIEEGIGTALIHPTQRLNDIFYDIYELDPKKDIEILRIKILEIISLLQTMPYKRNHKKSYFRRSDLDKIKELRKYAIQRLNERIPLETLSSQFHLSLTLSKQAFKEVYGMPYYTYMKQYRIHKALHYLKDPSLSIGNIASMLGYDNASKFSAVFKSIVGVTPNQYRKNNHQIKHLEFLNVEVEEG